MDGYGTVLEYSTGVVPEGDPFWNTSKEPAISRK
jgi:hypothetical protein